MSNYPIYERIFWFDRQIRRGKCPNASHMANHFEVSVKTAQRAIDFLRDRMAAPLEYDASKKGYAYTDQSFELPHLHATQEEILSILIAKKLLSQSAGGIISHAINRFSKKLFQDTRNLGLTEARLEEAFSATWTGYSPASSDIFMSVATALLNHRLFTFDYAAPGADIVSSRTAEPQHLQHYMGSWVLIAWCTLRGDYRKFFLSRMKNIRVLDEPLHPRPFDEWQYQINDAFGIFQGKEIRTVELKFSPFRAAWISEQIWHPDQTMSPTPDGGLVLSLPVSDFREIKLKILQFGADVEVLAPAELRNQVQEEIAKMAGIYK